MTQSERPWSKWLQPPSEGEAAPAPPPSQSAVARAGEAASRGDRARDGGDWATAAVGYAESLALVPGNTGLRVQLGHALKETGRFAEAEAAYRQATDEAPYDADARLQLGHVLKLQGKPDAAIQAYLHALRIQPDLIAVQHELIAMGARAHLPGVTDGREAAAISLARLTGQIDQAVKTIQDAAAISVFPVEAHDAFMRRFPIQPPPQTSDLDVAVVVAAKDASPATLRATLSSLIDQRHRNWTAIVEASPATANHPVGSLAKIDNRIAFIDGPAASGGARLFVEAGTLLDPDAIGWLAYGLERTGVDAICCDHDHYVLDWRSGPQRHSPVFQSMVDPVDLATNPVPPALILTRASGAMNARDALDAAVAAGPVAHLPRILASLPRATVTDRSTGLPGATSPQDGRRILVVIPTRDQAAMLETAIATLRAKAEAPGRIEFVLIDNRSHEPATATLLARLSAEAGVSVHAQDEPFNWSRCNNEGVAGRTQDLLVFANNDIEMLTQGWDALLCAHFDRPGVGVVGARLLYPDRSVQHAGILLGGWQDRPSHDGLWRGGDEPGPLNRWRRTRPVAAVTGAFLACTREVFEAVGGFDERLAIAYNDIDFCLKVRAKGQKVLYAADIELIHFESKTRGHNDNPEKIAWDDAELADMYARWGRWLFHDPGYNPQWASAANRPYDGLRDLPPSKVLTRLDASARPNPWAIDPTGCDPV